MIAATVYLAILKLKQEAEIKDPGNWIKVSVLDTIDRLPAGLIIELENKGPRKVGRSHFRLIFNIRGSNLCRVDTDIGGFEPEVKNQIVLRCSEWNSKISPGSYPIEVDLFFGSFLRWESQ